ncbi:MAG: hypothetical protein QM831_10290 [Kofleriaceae bacterium]
MAIAFLEVAINRIAVNGLRPEGKPPGWYVALDYLGLFLQYFAGTLVLVLLGKHAIDRLRERRDIRDLIAQTLTVVAAAGAALQLVMKPPDIMIVELTFAAAVIAVVISGLGRTRDLGMQLGLVTLAAPLLIHTLNVIGTRWLWPQTAYDGKILEIQQAGVIALSVGALVSPYVFAPRPFGRAVTRPLPVIVAMVVAAGGAIAARLWYAKLAKLAVFAIGVSIEQDQADPRLAIYLLAIATLTWTLVSCAVTDSPARRQIGAGILFVVLGGYAFKWAHHYLLPLYGLTLIADAGRVVRDEELSAMPITTTTPPVTDSVWQAYIAAVKTALGDFHTVTTRGEGGLVTTMLVGEKTGLAVRIRIERIEGSVIAFDIVVGREIDEVRGATLCLQAIPPSGTGINPSGPPAAPLFKSGDADLDAHFKLRGNALAFQKLFDPSLRARAATTLDGWFAYWDKEGVRYRVYPGRGAPLDHPLPLSDLALERPATPDRLVAVIELLVDIAMRGVEPQPAAPSSLDDIPVAST